MKTVACFVSVVFVVSCLGATPGFADEPRKDSDVITLEDKTITVQTPKPGVHIAVPKMKTTWKPEDRDEGFVKEILYGPIPPTPKPDSE